MLLDDVDVRASSIGYQVDPCRGFLSYSLEGIKPLPSGVKFLKLMSKKSNILCLTIKTMLMILDGQ